MWVQCDAHLNKKHPNPQNQVNFIYNDIRSAGLCQLEYLFMSSSLWSGPVYLADVCLSVLLMLPGGLQWSEACRVSAPRVCSPAQLVCDTPSHCWKLVHFLRGFFKYIDIKLLSKSTRKQLVVKSRKGTWLILLFLGTMAFLFTQPCFQMFVLLLMC